MTSFRKLVSTSNPVKFLCTVVFLWTIITLIIHVVHQKENLTENERVMLSEIEFPLIFKVCMKPGFDDQALNDMGYENNLAYFAGQSRLNSSLFGWAGHRSDGKILSNVSLVS